VREARLANTEIEPGRCTALRYNRAGLRRELPGVIPEVLREIPRSRYLLGLSLALALLIVTLGLAPRDRTVWLQENILVVCAIALIALTERKLPLSRISLTFAFLFLALHEIGAHYTYSEVPYDAWSRAVLPGGLECCARLGAQHFDRLVHFCYGLLIAYPVREFFLRVVNVRGFWGYALPLDLTMSSSMFYELTEWAAAELFGAGATHAFVGSQGDAWDAQKDMALASLGGCWR
jgi:putative membrane protein